MKQVRNRNMKARLLRVESLEPRQLLAATGVNSSGVSEPDSWYEESVFTVSANEQEMLELINRMRSDPVAELKRLVPTCNPEAEVGPWLDNSIWNGSFFTAFAPEVTQNCQERYPAENADTLRTFLSQWEKLSSAAPLAFNTTLSSVANNFTTYLMNHRNEFEGNFAHNVNLEADLRGQFYTYGENVYACPETVYNVISAMEFFHAAFAIDWGNSGAEHRNNIMNADFSEIGISVKSSSNNGTYSVIDFGTSTTGSRTDGAYLLGAVYGDADKDGFYDAQEGLGNVTLLIRNLDLDTGNTVEISSMNSGGYQIFLQNGHYTITATGGGYPGAVTKSVTINGSNQKIDFLTSDFSTKAPLVDLGGGVYYDFGVVTTYTEKAEQAGAISPITNISITDSTANNLQQAVVSLVNRSNGGAENITFTSELPDGMSIDYSFGDSTVTATLQGAASVNTYKSILSTLSWSFEYDMLSSGQTMSYEDRYITVKVFDGANWSVERIARITIDPLDPLMSISSTKVYEGDEGTRYIEFEAVLDTPATTDCSCLITPVAATDLSDQFTDDYFVDNTIQLNFIKGESRKKFSVAILSNYDVQKNKESLESNATYRMGDDLYFTLNVTECDGLAWRTGEVRGTIIDDDTPSLIITDSHWDFNPQLPFETEYGTQRFMYAVTAPDSGLMTWSAESDVPNGFTISIYETAYSETPMAGVTSQPHSTGQKVQWAVSKGTKYIIKLEKITDSTATYISGQRFAFLPVTTDNVVMVEPLMPEVGEKAVQVQWKENGVEIDVNGRSWALGLDNPFRVEASESEIALEILFDGNSGSFTNNGSSIGFTPTGSPETSDYGWFDGFEEIAVVGSNSFETLYFEGTAGDDQLFFESDSGSGWFITDANTDRQVKYRFTNVTYIDFTGGIGGNDTAELHDSRFADYADTSETSVVLYGGGYRVSVTDFQDIKLLFDKGGNDTVTLINETADVEALLFPSMLNVSGKTTRSKTTSTDMVPFKLDIKYFDHFIGTPKSPANTLYVLSGNNTSTKYETGIGWFSSVDSVSGDTARAQNFQNIIFGAMENVKEPIVDVHVADAVLKTDPLTNVVTLEKSISTPAGAFLWKLWLPSKFNQVDLESALVLNAVTQLAGSDTDSSSNTVVPVEGLVAAVMEEELVEEAIAPRADSCYDRAVSSLFETTSEHAASSFDWGLDILLDVDLNQHKNRRVVLS